MSCLNVTQLTLLFSAFVSIYLSIIRIREYVKTRLFITYVTKLHGLDNQQ